MASSSRTQLMDEIYDQFLVCKICYELYKRPKTLQCLHTFCMECLEQHQDAELERSYRYLLYSRAISCPICRKKTELPSGGVRRLPDNFLVANLGAVITRRLPDTKLAVCEICKPEIPPQQKQATCRCLDCSKLLCKNCVELHRRTKVTQEHSIFDIEVEKDIECKVHKGETVRFYCEPCEMCICVVCTFQEHKGHEVSSFAEGMQKHSRSLDNLVEVCKDRIDLVKDQLDVIYKCETQIKEAEESIRDMAIETISDIRDKEKESVQKIYDEYGEETFDFMKEKETLQDNLDNLQSTCNLTDIITKDKSMELLLLKKEIQEKLQNLLHRQVRQPPENAMKEVKFIPGNVVFGYLSVKAANGEDGGIDSEEEDEVFTKPHTSYNDISKLTPVKDNVVLMDSMSQTDGVRQSEKFTTMGSLLQQICDQLTQTDPAKNFDRGTSPMEASLSPTEASLSPCSPSSRSPLVRSRSSSTDTREVHTMTPCTPTMRRKVQTDTVSTYNEGTGTVSTPVSTKFTNTQAVPSREKSTLTQIQENRSKCTDTHGLAVSDERGTATSQVYLSTIGTTTDTVAKVNKATHAPLPNCKDKICGTTRLIQNDRETMTRYVAKLDMGVTAKILGTDKNVGTKAIVTFHTSIGDGDVRTRDQGSETPWKQECVQTSEQATMPALLMQDKGQRTEPINVEDRASFTAWFNMASEETETVAVSTNHASTGTVPPAVKSRGLNTTPQPVAHKGIPVQQDFLPKKPKMDTCMSQTIVSFEKDIIMQNLTPCDKSIGTEVIGEIQVVRTTAALMTTGTSTEACALADGTTTVSSLVYTCDVSTATMPPTVERQLPLSKDASTSLDALVVTTTTTEQGTSTPQSIMVNNGNDANTPQLVHKQFGSQSVVYVEQSVATTSPAMLTASVSAHPLTADMATVTHVQTVEKGTDYPRITMSAKETSTSHVTTSHIHTNTESAAHSDISTMTLVVPMVTQQTTTMHHVGMADIAVETTKPTTVDQGQDPVKVTMLCASVNTVPKSYTTTSVATDHVNMNTSGTTTHHMVQVNDMGASTEVTTMSDASTNMNITSADQGTHTSVQTSDVGVLKRPHSMSRGVSTKRTKLVSTAMATDDKSVVEQAVMTSVSHGARDILFEDRGIATTPPPLTTQCVGTPCVDFVESSTSMPAVVLQDRESSPVQFGTSVDRGSSPIDFTNTVERSCSPIQAMTKDAGVHAQARTREMHTSTTKVKTRDTCSGFDRPKYVDKQNSPVRNLVATRTKFTCTPHVATSDRAGSPIPPPTSETSTNTRIYELTDREVSPLRIPTTDHGVLATVSMITKSSGTPQVISKEQGTVMKQMKVLHKCTGMPHVAFVEKETSTTHIHVMHKNVSTENIQSRDQSTSMSIGVAEPYKDLVAPKKAIAVTRGTCTQTVPMETKETCTPVSENTDRASSPVLTQTADKGVMANKAEMLDTKDCFQGVGKGKANRPLSNSPKPTLTCIKEDSQESDSSSDECSSSSKDTLPDFPSFGSPKFGSPRTSSPRLAFFNPTMEGRPQMGLGFGNIAHREKFWRSSPTLGTSHARTHFGTTMGTSMLHPEARPPPVPLWNSKTEAATSTKDVSTENRATSTTDIEKEDKAICTVPETTTMQCKMAECINKLKTVRQRLEQQPIYSTASTAKTGDTESQATTSSIPSSPLLSVKSKSVGSNLHEGEYAPFDSPSLRRKPPIVFSSTSESPSESSDQEQHPRSRSNKARKQRLEINQLLRSSSLPESPEPPSSAERSPGARPKIARLPPKGDDKKNDNGRTLSKDRPKSPRDRSKVLKEQSAERPKSPRERPKSARTASRERPTLQRQLSHESVKPAKDHHREPHRTKRDTKGTDSKAKSSAKDRTGAVSSPQLPHKSGKSRSTAKFDELHPLLPTSPRNTRRLSEGTEAVRARLGETPKQRRERLEQQLSFEDRKALTRQYFQDTRPVSPAASRLTRPRSARSASSKELPPLVEKPPKVPSTEQ